MTPTADEYIQAGLTAFRAMPKQKTVFGAAGRFVSHSDGERVLYGPNGNVIGRVIENPLGGTQVETDEALHAVARVPQIRIVVSRKYREVVSVG